MEHKQCTCNTNECEYTNCEQTEQEKTFRAMSKTATDLIIGMRTNTTDDFGQEVTTHYIDGKTVYGPWASMAPSSFWKYGIGLGVGKGQAYVKDDAGVWVATNIIPRN